MQVTPAASTSIQLDLHGGDHAGDLEPTHNIYAPGAEDAPLMGALGTGELTQQQHQQHQAALRSEMQIERECNDYSLYQWFLSPIYHQSRQYVPEKSQKERKSPYDSECVQPWSFEPLIGI